MYLQFLVPGAPAEDLEDSDSNAESGLGDSLPASGSQTGTSGYSRGVVRQTHKEMCKGVLKKKKRKVDESDTELSDMLLEANKTSTREVISLVQSAINKPSAQSTSLASFGQWVANVTAGLHRTLEHAWTKEVSKTSMQICLIRCSISIACIY